MSKTAMVFFTLMLVLASCFIIGCGSLPFSGTPAPTEIAQKTNTGITPHDSPERRFAFDEIARDLASTNFVVVQNNVAVMENATAANLSLPPASTSPEKHIKSIRGVNLDESGNASSWSFVVEQGDQLAIVTYDNQGMVFSSSPGTIKRSEIFIDQIMTPRELFEKNRAVILDTTRTGTGVTRDLSLGEGSYTLSISGRGAPRVLVFDAKTGALKSTND
jgi:hypothetical protein